MNHCQRSIAALLLTAVLCFLPSCGGDDSTAAGTDNGTATVDTEAQTEAVTLSAPELAAELASSCTFSEELTQNDIYLANHPFGFAALTESRLYYTAYVPAGIIPEEVFVFETATSDDTQAVVDKLNAYVEYQISEYSRYAAGQVPKLDDPVILTKDNLVVYVVSADNAGAKETAKGLLGIG